MHYSNTSRINFNLASKNVLSQENDANCILNSANTRESRSLNIKHHMFDQNQHLQPNKAKAFTYFLTQIFLQKTSGNIPSFLFAFKYFKEVYI